MAQRPAEVAIRERIKTLDGTIGDYNKVVQEHYKLIGGYEKKKKEVKAEITQLEEDLKKLNG